MKMLALGLMGYLLLASSLFATEENPDTETSHFANQEIWITLTHRVPEGVIFFRRTVEGVPLFGLSLFMNQVPYRTRLLTRKAFSQHLREFDRVFYAEGRSLRAVSPPCPRYLRRTLQVNRQTRREQSLCLTAMSQAGEQSLSRWYDEIKSLF